MIAKALDQAIGKESVLSLAKRHGAIGAVNGGFFAEGDYRDGLPARQRGVIGWKRGGQHVLFDRLLIEIEGADIKIVPNIEPSMSSQWDDMEYIVGGAPLLIHKGIIIDDYEVEKITDSFCHQQHARTAIGMQSNGKWIFVVIDV